MLKISIVTPSFNSAKYIEDCIQSVLNQNYPNFEHIIVDGGSTDETLNILKKHPHLKLISEKDNGQTDAINKGFKLVSGDIYAWLNADDKYEKDAFFKVAEAFNKYKDADIIYGDIYNINQDNEIINSKKEYDFNLFTLLYYRCYIESTATFFRKYILHNGDFLDESFHFSMDLEYYVRLAKRAYKFKHITEFLASFRWHGVNKSLDVKSILNERKRILSLYGRKISKNDKVNYFYFHFVIRKIAFLTRVALRIMK